MRINNNVTALNTFRMLNVQSHQNQQSMEKLASGLRINRAGDDAAGLAISEKMRGQIRGLDQAQRNSQDGISLIQTAEGALAETHSILNRMRELVLQAGNGTMEEEDRDAIQKEIDALIEELGGGADNNGISDRTQFNGKDLLDGNLDIDIQIGANSGQKLNITIGGMDATTLGVNGVDVSGATYDPDTDLDAIDDAIKDVSEQRAELGAAQNRLEHTINNLGAAHENLTASESRIRDVNMASEMVNQTKFSILSQAAQAMLAKANQEPQGVLQLLR